MSPDVGPHADDFSRRDEEPDVAVPDERWRALRRNLDAVNAWDWNEWYFAPACDGAGWHLDLAWGKRLISVSGSNAYPGEDATQIDYEPSRRFERYLRAMSRLVGRPFR